MSAENKGIVTLIVPQELRVNESLLEGDTESEIIFEITDFEEENNYFKEMHERGSRIFDTEDDWHLIVHSEESLRYKEIRLVPLNG